MRVKLVSCIFILMVSVCCRNQPARSGMTHSANLSWHASTTKGVTYSVFRGTKFGGPYAGIANGVVGLTYTDYAVTSGGTYYYRVAADCTTCSPSESVPTKSVRGKIP